MISLNINKYGVYEVIATLFLFLINLFCIFSFFFILDFRISDTLYSHPKQYADYQLRGGERMYT